MSTEIIHESRPVARKEYRCDASDFLCDDLSEAMSFLTFTEKRAVVIARKAGWKISVGVEYVRQFNRCGGDTWTFRAIPKMHDICCKYELYPEQ